MTEYAEVVAKRRLELEAIEWGNNIMDIHAFNTKTTLGMKLDQMMGELWILDTTMAELKELLLVVERLSKKTLKEL